MQQHWFNNTIQLASKTKVTSLSSSFLKREKQEKRDENYFSMHAADFKKEKTDQVQLEANQTILLITLMMNEKKWETREMEWNERKMFFSFEIWICDYATTFVGKQSVRWTLWSNEKIVTFAIENSNFLNFWLEILWQHKSDIFETKMLNFLATVFDCWFFNNKSCIDKNLSQRSFESFQDELKKTINENMRRNMRRQFATKS